MTNTDRLDAPGRLARFADKVEAGLPEAAEDTLTPWHGSLSNDPVDGYLRRCIDIQCQGTSEIAETANEFMRRAARAAASPEPTPGLREALPCGYRFGNGGKCLTNEAHPIHHGQWTKGETNHDYQPFDRRNRERRAALAASPAPEPTGLDVAALAKVLEYTGDGDGEGYHGPHYHQYAKNIIAAYLSAARLNGIAARLGEKP